MVTLAVAGVGSALTSGLTAGTASYAAASIAVAAATAAASYVDQRYVLPALFGSDDPAADNKVGNLQLSTTNPGAPRFKAYGRAAFVPGHFIWNQNQRVRYGSIGGGGKGSAAPQSISERFADIGIAACDGPITSFLTAFANRQPFFGSEFNDVIYADHRLAFRVDINTPYLNDPDATFSNEDYYLVIEGAEGETPTDFNGFFSAGDLVVLENAQNALGEPHPLVAERDSNGSYVDITKGLYIVYFVNPVAASNQPRMVLAPIGGQDVYGEAASGADPTVAIVPGTPDNPMQIRRIDDGLGGFTHDWANLGARNDGSFFLTPGGGKTGASFFEDSMFSASAVAGFSFPGEYGDGSNTGVQLTFGGWMSQEQSISGSEPNWLRSITRSSRSAYSATVPPSKVLTSGGLYELYGFCDAAGNRLTTRVTAYFHIADDDGYSGGALSGDVAWIEIAIPTSQYNELLSEAAFGPIYLGNGQFPIGINDELSSGLSTTVSTNSYQVYTPNSSGNSSLDNTIQAGGALTGIRAATRTGGNGTTPNPAALGGHGSVGFCMIRSTGYNFSYDTEGNIAQQGAEIYLGGDDHQEDSTFKANLEAEGKISASQDAPTHRGLAHISFANLNLYQFGNVVPQVTFKVSESYRRTVGQTVSAIFDIAAPPGSVDAASLSTTEMYGYSFAAGTTIKEALQPLSMMYRFGMQERGGTVKLLMDHELPFFQVPSRDLNAAQWDKARQLGEGFTVKPVDEDDVPQRVTIEYLAIGNGNEEAESAGTRQPGSSDEESRDTVKISCRPVVAPQAFVKDAAVKMLDKIQTESVAGATVLGPGYVDILPGTVIQTSTRDWDYRTVTLTSTSAIVTDAIGPIIEGTVSISLIFITDEGLSTESSESATIIDDGDGGWDNIPDGVSVDGVSTVDYSAGTINFTINSGASPSVTLYTAEPVGARYRYERAREFRVNKSTIGGFDHSNNIQVVETIYDGVVPPFPYAAQQRLGRVVGDRQSLTPKVIDVPALTGGQGVDYLVALDISPQSQSANYSGGALYESTDGTSNWTLRDTAAGYTTTFDILGGDALPEYRNNDNVIARVDWKTGLAMTNATPGFSPEDATIEDVAAGRNRILLPDGEIIAFLRVDGQGPTWTLYGIVRGLRGTATRAMYSKPVSMQGCVLLPAEGIESASGIASWVGSSAYGVASRTSYFKAVPPGVSIDEVDAVELTLTGRSTLPPAPVWASTVSGETTSTKKVGDDIEISWAMGMFDQAPIFGQSTMPYSYERYEIYVWSADEGEVARYPTPEYVEANHVRRVIIGDNVSGFTSSIKRYCYKKSDQTADGFSPGDEIAISVRQVGPTGPGDFAIPTTIEVS